MAFVFSNKVISQAFSVLGMLSCTLYSAAYMRHQRGASRGIMEYFFMSSIQDDPPELSSDIHFPEEAFQYKVNGTVQKVYNKEKRPATLAPLPIAVSFLFSFKFSCHWLVLPGYWTLLLMFLQHH